MIFEFLVFLTAFLFFGVIPGVGAITARSQWRMFRTKIRGSIVYPYLNYSAVQGRVRGKMFRLFGSVDAISGDNIIRIKGDDFSVKVSLKDVLIYILPVIGTDSEPQIVPWQRITSLVAGTKVYVAGRLEMVEGEVCFVSSKANPLMLVFYDGEKKDLLERAIWCGRQRNEYWNHYTLVSLITGVFVLLLEAYFLSPQMSLAGLLAISLSLYPLFIFLPPGVIFFILYRYFWKKARYLRAERDLMLVPLTPFKYFKKHRVHDLAEDNEYTVLSTGEEYIMIKGQWRDLRKYLAEGSSTDIRHSKEGREAFLFGKYNSQTNQVEEPEDFLVEKILVRGNPALESGKCDKKAKIFTLLAGFFIVLDLAPNLILTLLLLHHIIR